MDRVAPDPPFWRIHMQQERKIIMKKKSVSLLLALTLVFSLFPAAAAEEGEAVTPTPPSWCPEEEYAVFPGSAAYEPENWEIITQTRAEVEWGAVNLGALPLRWKFTGLPNSYTVPTGEIDKNGREYAERVDDFGVLLEKALVEVRLLYIHDQYNGPYWTTLSTVLEDGGDEKLASLTDQQRYAVLLWTARGILRYDGVGEKLNKFLPYLMNYPQFTLETLTNSEIFTEREKASLEKRVAQSWEDYSSHIEILLDGQTLELDVFPEVKNERTMVPIRAVAEALGADVEWVQDTQKIVMTRAGVTVTMTLNSTTAAIDGETVEMDVAPYATDGRTLIPARYVAEFFGQKVDWDGNRRQVLIEEDKTVAGDSNLEQWAVNMGLIRGFIDSDANYGLPEPWGRPIQFGQYRRNEKEVKTVRTALASPWNIANRDSLIMLVQRMTPHGHNDDFQDAAAVVNSLSGTGLKELIARSPDTDKYMWLYTKEISERWGEKGILAWDLSRMANLVQWGYVAGYITYEEALKLIEPAVQMTAETFSNWDEFYLTYLDGYNWWARNDVYTYRKMYEAALRETYENDPYGREMPEDLPYWIAFPRASYYQYTMNRVDDTLFETGVIGLPEA